MALALDLNIVPGSVWQDSAGTIPAAVGDPVGRVDDASGSGFHVTQATTGNKPTLLQDANGHLYLDFDGVGDVLQRELADGIPQGTSAGYTYSVVCEVDAALPASDTGSILLSTYSNARELQYGQGFSINRNLFGSGRIHFGQTDPGNANRLYFNNESDLRGSLKTIVYAQRLGPRSEGLFVNGAAEPFTVFRQTDNPVVVSAQGPLQVMNGTQGRFYRGIVHDTPLFDAEAATLSQELYDLYSNPAGGGGGEVEVSGADAGVVASEPLLTPRYSVSPDGALVGVSAAEADAVPRYVVTPEGALVSVGASQPDLSFEEAGEARPESASVAVEASSPALTPRYAIFPESSRSTVSAPQASIGERVRRYMKRIRLGIGIGY